MTKALSEAMSLHDAEKDRINSKMTPEQRKLRDKKFKEMPRDEMEDWKRRFGLKKGPERAWVELSKKILGEEAPVTNAGSGAIAGIGVGDDGEPGVNANSQPATVESMHFAGHHMIEIDEDVFQNLKDLRRVGPISMQLIEEIGARVVKARDSGAVLFLKYTR